MRGVTKARYSIALDAHLDLLEWLRGPHGGTWGAWYPKSQAYPESVTDFAVKVAAEMDVAETVFVTREMCDLIEHASHTMPSLPLQSEQLFWRTAFVYFERPIQGDHKVSPEDAEPLRTRAIWWQGAARIQQAPSRQVPAEEDLADRPGIVHMTFVDTVEAGLKFAQVRTHLFPFDRSGWSFGTHWEATSDMAAVSPHLIGDGLADERKLLLALNLLSSQYVAVVSGQPAQRSTRRRMKPSPIRPNYGDVQVVTLRRAYDRGPKQEGESDFEYSHRFLVRGFWRHQWYPSRQEHELIWIDPFVKGPKHKPLIIKDRIWNLAR